MKRELVWIPVIGIFLTRFNPFIVMLSEKWIVYQMVSTVIFCTTALITIIKVFNFFH